MLTLRNIIRLTHGFRKHCIVESSALEASPHTDKPCTKFSNTIALNRLSISN